MKLFASFNEVKFWLLRVQCKRSPAPPNFFQFLFSNYLNCMTIYATKQSPLFSVSAVVALPGIHCILSFSVFIENFELYTNVKGRIRKTNGVQIYCLWASHKRKLVIGPQPRNYTYIKQHNIFEKPNTFAETSPAHNIHNSKNRFWINWWQLHHLSICTVQANGLLTISEADRNKAFSLSVYSNSAKNI